VTLGVALAAAGAHVLEHLVELADQLEDWTQPKQLVDGRWEAERARYLRWRGAMSRM